MDLEPELVEQAAVIYSLNDFKPELFGLPPFPIVEDNNDL